MRVKFKLSGVLGDDSWDAPASSADSLFDFANSGGSNTLAYLVLAAGALLALPYLQSSPAPKRRTSRKRSPRRKLTNGVKGKRQAITLQRQPDGSYA